MLKAIVITRKREGFLLLCTLSTTLIFWQLDKSCIEYFESHTPSNSPRVVVEDVDCRAIREDHNGTFLDDIRALMETSDVPVNNDTIIAETASDCTSFKRDRGYNSRRIQAEESEFPIAFSLLVYKDSSQVERLIRAIYRPHNIHCIHVDKKSSQEFKRAIKDIASCFDNMFLIEEIDVVWAAFTVLLPELNCMRELLKSPIKWRYFINLTGQEFPLKTNWELVRILKTFNGSNDIPGVTNNQAEHRATFVYKGYINTHIKKKPVPMKLDWKKGGAHIIASRAFVDYVVHNETSIKLQNYLNDTGYSDEIFFATLNNNPHLGAPGAVSGPRPTVTRYKKWAFITSGWACEGRIVRGICILGIGDLKRLVEAPEIFVNKLFYDFEHFTLDCLEEWYYQKVHNETIYGQTSLNMTIYEERMQKL